MNVSVLAVSSSTVTVSWTSLSTCTANYSVLINGSGTTQQVQTAAPNGTQTFANLSPYSMYQVWFVAEYAYQPTLLAWYNQTVQTLQAGKTEDGIVMQSSCVLLYSCNSTSGSGSG